MADPDILLFPSPLSEDEHPTGHAQEWRFCRLLEHGPEECHHLAGGVWDVQTRWTARGVTSPWSDPATIYLPEPPVGWSVAVLLVALGVLWRLKVRG